MGNIKSCIKDLEFWFKVIECLLALFVWIAWAGNSGGVQFRDSSVVAVGMGYWIVWLGFVLAYIFDDKHKWIDIYFLIAGIIVFLWTTIIVMYPNDGYSRSGVMTMGILAIAELVVCIVDLILKLLDKF